MLYPTYTVAIRTLGKAGDAFRTLIRSLEEQEVKPASINVYLAEGYPRPKQVGTEVYYTCPKGLATQRALPFREIETEYILFLDDDLYLPQDTVKKLFDGLLGKCGDCISPNIYPNHQWDLKHKLVQGFFYSTWPSYSSRFAFRIRRCSYYSYHAHPSAVMKSQSCAGACLLMKTKVYHQLHYEDEVWLDNVRFASGQDQLFAFKLYRYGYTLLVHYGVTIKHLDAQTGHNKNENEADLNKRFVRYLIWHRTIWQPDNKFGRYFDICAFHLVWFWQFLLSLVTLIKGGGTTKTQNIIHALKNAKVFAQSPSFHSLPVWQTVR